MVLFIQLHNCIIIWYFSWETDEIRSVYWTARFQLILYGMLQVVGKEELL